MRIIISGICGRMGSELAALCEKGYLGMSLAAGVDFKADESVAHHHTSFDGVTEKADCIVDFSHHLATNALCAFAIKENLPLVIATTGQTEDELNVIHETAKSIPVFMSANMSVGVALLVELAKQAAKAFPEADIEIIEKHHNRKLDAPSGTALMIYNAINSVRDGAFSVFGRHGQQAKRMPGEIGIHAVRLGNLPGEHEVIIATDTQSITLRHETYSRSLLAEGAATAAAFLVTQGAAGMYGMQDMLKA